MFYCPTVVKLSRLDLASHRDVKSKEEQEEVIDITETRCEMSTQTEPLPELISCGVQVEQLPVPAITRDFANQFPQDASVEVRNDHSYARGEEPQTVSATCTVGKGGPKRN